MASNPHNPAPHRDIRAFRYTVIRVEKKGGIEGGKQKNKGSTNAENNSLKDKQKATQYSAQCGYK